ncbi:MAG: putative porin, partial [Paludibacteraceae bacterium]|nr:putative porin [Paludibacteraceae bacterium]
GCNKYAMAGLTAFISHEFRSFEIADSTAGVTVKDVFRHKYRDNIVSVGGQLIRTQGKALHYNVTGEMALTGEEKGSLSIEGVGELNIPISKKDTASIQVKAFVKNQTPTFYYRHFHSQHLWWNNELSKQMRTRVEGTISLPRTGTSLTIGNEIVKNYTYLALGSKNSDVCVKQAGSPIHVFSATVRQALKLGIFNWEGEVNYQKSSSDVIPLPQLNAYTNLFIDVRLAKVLRIELGADARYFTEYYAPAYSPILMQFYNQAPDSREKVGNYPLVNLYANCHLKHTRFYVMMSHVNEGSGSRRYFNFPGYPMNPSIIKFGVSWNFFN